MGADGGYIRIVLKGARCGMVQSDGSSSAGGAADEVQLGTGSLLGPGEAGLGRLGCLDGGFDEGSEAFWGLLPDGMIMRSSQLLHLIVFY